MSNEFNIKNGLIVQGNTNITGNTIITGSLTVLGPAYLTASQAISASHSAFAITSAFAQNFNPDATASYAMNAETASYVVSTTVDSISASFEDLYSDTASFGYLFATSSNAISSSFADTASYILNAVSASYALTASYASNVPETASHAIFADTASFIPTSSILTFEELTIKTELNVRNSYFTGTAEFQESVQFLAGLTGSLLGTASAAISASHADDADWALTADTASYVVLAQTASYVALAVSASRAVSASAADWSFLATSASVAITADSALLAETASYILNAVSASYALTASYASNVPATASHAIFAETASFLPSDSVITVSELTVLTALDAVSGLYVGGAAEVNGTLFAYGGVSGSLDGTASYALFAISSSEASHSVLADTSSLSISASYATYANLAADAISASYATFAEDAQDAVLASTASYVDWANVDNKPYIISSSLQFGPTDVFNVGTITASAIQVDVLHVNTVTSSVVYSSGSNTFGSSLTDTQQFTGSITITGSLTVSGPVNFGPTPINATASYANVALNSISSSYVNGGVDATSLKLTQNGVTALFANSVVSGIVTTTIIDEFPETVGYAVRWLVGVKSGTNFRTSEVTATWDASTDTVQFTETSTLDVGNTTDLVLSATYNGSNIALVATPTVGNWEVRVTRIAI